MIIAWSVFIFGLLMFVGSVLLVLEEHKDGTINLLFWFLVTISSAQYIWG